MICLMNSNPYPCVANDSLEPNSANGSSGDNRLYESQTSSSIDDDQSCRSSPSSASDTSNISSSNDDLAQYSLKHPTKPSITMATTETIITPDIQSEMPVQSGWKRLIVNKACSDQKVPPEWGVNFISPEGQRFHSHQELMKHLDDNKIDPYQISFLANNSGDEGAESTKNALESFPCQSNIALLSVDFCNMRQNIFDIRKRKGRKRSRDGIGRQNSRRNTTSSEGSANEDADQPEAKKLALDPPPVIREEEELEVETVGESPMRSESTSIVAGIVEDLLPGSQTPPSASVPFISLDDSQLEDVDENSKNVPCNQMEEGESNEQVEKDPLSIDDWSGNPSPFREGDNCELNLQLSEIEDNDDDESNDISKGIEIESCNLGDDSDSDVQIIGEVKVEDDEVDLDVLIEEIKNKSCSVQMTDVFGKFPLAMFKCLQCSKPYGSKNEISFDFECHMMFVVCDKCSWWTSRRIGTMNQQPP